MEIIKWEHFHSLVTTIERMFLALFVFHEFFFFLGIANG